MTDEQIQAMRDAMAESGRRILATCNELIAECTKAFAPALRAFDAAGRRVSVAPQAASPMIRTLQPDGRDDIYRRQCGHCDFNIVMVGRPVDFGEHHCRRDDEIVRVLWEPVTVKVKMR